MNEWDNGDHLAIRREDDERLRFELECLRNANEQYDRETEELKAELAEARAALNHADSLWMVNCTPMAFSAWREMHADAIAKARAAEEGA